MIVYGLKACDTCRKALRALREAGLEAELRDVREVPLSEADLLRFKAVFGEALINRRSTTWRELSEEKRAQDSVTLILAHPTLMKRPVIEDGDILTLGWDAEAQARWL